jgi:UDP-glucose 4-epimerase
LKILITGGAGYIGSHTLIELDKSGYNFIVFDNLSNSSKESIKRVEKIINKSISFEEGDVRDKKTLEKVFKKYDIDSVIHFAGLKAVGESVCVPLKYYDNNIMGTLVLLKVMKKFNCKKIVFSSSSTVYGKPDSNPMKEDFPVGNTANPYGRTKYFIEEILKDLYVSDNSFKIAILRYFNPVGAHESGMIGENPNGIPNNLMPYISQVAVGKREFLSILGADYDTHDGTGVRDIHVVDLACGHVKLIDYLNKKTSMEPLIVNLGTGIGYSVLNILKAFEKVSGKIIPYYAKYILGWEAKKTIEDMCADSWVWQSRNLNGYKEKIR